MMLMTTMNDNDNKNLRKKYQKNLHKKFSKKIKVFFKLKKKNLKFFFSFLPFNIHKEHLSTEANITDILQSPEASFSFVGSGKDNMIGFADLFEPD